MSRLVVLLTLSIAPTELFAALVSGIQVVRAQPGDYLLARGLSQLALEAFYGRFELSHGPLSYLQRGIIESDVLLDLTARLRYYEEARGCMLRHQGAVYVAKDEAGRACGFADVGLAVYDPQKQTFRLPKRPEGDVEQLEGSELRPYLSNLAVSEACRRAGVGRLLVDACEAEAKCWEDGAYERVWLEVSASNVDAQAFYRRLGYTQTAETRGREIVRKRWSFESQDVQRWLMSKDFAGEKQDKLDGLQAGASGAVVPTAQLPLTEIAPVRPAL